VVGRVIDGLERHPGLLLRLPVMVNNAGFTRGDRFVVAARHNEAQPGRGMALDVSVRYTQAVRAALAAAAEPIQFAALAEQLRTRFPTGSPDKIYSLLAELVSSRVLLTSLRAPMTTVDALAHVVEQLEVLRAEDLPDVATLAKNSPRSATNSPTSAEAAAPALLRLTPHPFGSPAWKDFHARFRDRYGTGAVVPVRDVVADSGLGFPAGFLGAPRVPAAHALTERDATLLGLIQ
jgi:lantibiotic biosynthesis protein